MRVLKFTTIFLLVLCASNLFAQTANVSGKYEGAVDLQGAGKLKISAEIRQTGDKLSGVFNTPLGDAPILEGGFRDGGVTITLDAGGDDIFLSGKLAASGKISGELSGEISGAPTKGIFELNRTGDATAPADYAVNLNLTKEQWREDLRFLAAELPKRHKNAFNLISRERFEKSVAELDAKIPASSNEEIVLGMSRIASRIGDGHTGLSWGARFPRVPLRLYWFGKELRVAEVAKEFPRLNGARVLKIGGEPVEKIYERSREYIAPNESEQFVLDTSVSLFTRPAFLKIIGAARANDRATYEFVDLQGKKFSRSMRAISASEKREYIKPYKTAPLYLQQPGEPFYYEYLNDAKIVYVNFRWYPRRARFREFSKKLFDFIDANPVEKIVFDLRQNGGGDFTRGRDFFIKPLKEREKFQTRGRLFVIAGRETYSAGMTNTADFRNDLKAIIVGEPTGARPVGYMENRGFSLPNSHLPVSYSIEFYKFSETDTPGILPDKLIEPDWNSYLNGRDKALELILAYPKTK